MTKQPHKKKAKGKRKRKQHTGAKISKDRADKMQAFWEQCDNVARVADKFGHSRSTVYAMMKRYDWRDARARVESTREKLVAQEMAKDDISNLKLAQALRNKSLKVLLDQKTILAPSVKDGVAALRLVAELEGDVLPEGATGQNVLKLITGGTADQLSDADIGHKLTQYGAIFERIGRKSKARHHGDIEPSKD